ncbi:coiled-coil domain-containing protein 25-like [Paramacrobiotus metropolitanus]|uniref:coiled-coil domain-containing protein 25-like n=1 Tax=Paramacrobiotus metropolitanus TaxID=2943436 RepID=UPI002445F450|nr:coiled-coil domain-containing protein 25-like [Paramacrobiotus metropolitanus]
MVFFFTSNIVTPAVSMYMGVDKYENEELIKHSWPEDVWFHVDKLSSAHVYLRLEPGQTIDDIPETVVTDCCQLVKANSIQGNKENNVGIVYTLASNLKKTGDMDTGQVGFKDQKAVRRARVEKRINEIVNRLEKTRKDMPTQTFIEAKEERDRKERDERKKDAREQKAKDAEEARRKQEEASLRSYDTMMRSENMKTNRDRGDDDDFM